MIDFVAILETFWIAIKSGGWWMAAFFLGIPVLKLYQRIRKRLRRG